MDSDSPVLQRLDVSYFNANTSGSQLTSTQINSIKDVVNVLSNPHILTKLQKLLNNADNLPNRIKLSTRNDYDSFDDDEESPNVVSPTRTTTKTATLTPSNLVTHNQSLEPAVVKNYVPEGVCYVHFPFADCNYSMGQQELERLFTTGVGMATLQLTDNGTCEFPLQYDAEARTVSTMHMTDPAQAGFHFDTCTLKLRDSSGGMIEKRRKQKKSRDEDTNVFSFSAGKGDVSRYYDEEEDEASGAVTGYGIIPVTQTDTF